MQSRATVPFVVLLAAAAAALTGGLWSLVQGKDLLALALCVLGAALLRALFRAARSAEGGGS